MAGANAVTLCGGPEILLKYGRIDIPKNYFPSEKSNLTFCISQSKKLPCNFFPYPDGSHTPEFHIRNVFFRLGFSSREIVALCGAHTIGRGFRDRTGVCPFSSGDRGATQYTRLTSLAKVRNFHFCLNYLPFLDESFQIKSSCDCNSMNIMYYLYIIYMLSIYYLHII